MIAKAWWFSIIIIIAIVIGLGWWLSKTQLVEVVHIQAPQKVEYTLPVYAQFVVTQIMTVPTAVPLAQITLPILTSAQPQGELHIALQQSGQSIQQWSVPLSGYAPNQAVDVNLPVEPVRVVQGVVELQVSQPDLTGHQADQATRLFVESADDAYPHGNYRIANNQKSGDISVVLLAKKTNGQVYMEYSQHHPLPTAISLIRVGILLLLVLSLPWLWWRQNTVATIDR